jgi:hypothetical protein
MTIQQRAQAIDHQLLEGLTGSLSGSALRPDDDGYEEAR